MNVGDKVVVVKNISNHGFKIGQVVLVAEIDSCTGVITCIGKNQIQWYIWKDEVEPYKK